MYICKIILKHFLLYITLLLINSKKYYNLPIQIIYTHVKIREQMLQ